jgi:hypothetical protein
MTIGTYSFGLGALIALIVFIIALVLWVVGHVPDKDVVYGLVMGLAVARLVP